MTSSEPTGELGQATTDQYNQVRDLASLLAPEDKTFAVFIKGVVASIERSGNQTTITVYLGGDTTVSIPGIRILDSYSPVVGDTVQLGKQGTEIFVVGRINGNQTPAENGWVTPTFGTGVSSSTIRYRVILDNGDRKVQIKGSCVTTSASSTLWTMPPEARPSEYRQMVIGRNVSGGANTALVEFNTSGAVVLSGKDTGMMDISTGGWQGTENSIQLTSGGTAPGTNQPNNPPNWTGYAATSGISNGEPPSSGAHVHNFDHTHTVNSHTHTVPPHSHGYRNVQAPTSISLNGIEFFI